MRRGFSILGLVVALGLIVAACGGTSATSTAVPPTKAPTATTAGSTSAPTTAGQPTATTAATATVRPTAAPTATTAPAPTSTAAPISAGEIKITTPNLQNFELNPGISLTGGRGNPMEETLYDPTMSTKIEGPFDPATGFVLSFSANADSTVWTIKVRDNVVFHNGDKATAEDLAFLIDLALAADAPYNSASEIKAVVEKVAAVDATTMVVTLKKLNIVWPQTTLSRSRVQSGSSFYLLAKKYTLATGQQAANKNPVGSGPYKFKSVTVGDRVVVEAVDYRHWYYGVPRTKTITFIQTPEESTRVALLKAKDVDAAPIALSNINPIKQAGFRTVVRENSLVGQAWSAQYPAVIPGYGPNPLANKLVRHALFYYGVDRKAIVDKFLYGVGVPSTDFPVTPSELYAFKPQEVPVYDPVKAKALLVQAGSPNGFPVDFYTNTVSPTIPTAPDIDEAVAVWWENLGIKVTRKPYTGAVLQQLWLAKYKTGDWGKPTLSGIGAGPGYREIGSSDAVLHYNPEAFPFVSNDPEGLRLGLAWQNAKTIDEYAKAGQAYQAYAHENANTWIGYYYTGEAWAASDKMSSRWKLGKDAGFRLSDAVALR